MRLFDWLAPRRRCVILGCANKPNEPSALCVEHELELSDKIRRAVDLVRMKCPGDDLWPKNTREAPQTGDIGSGAPPPGPELPP